MKKGVLRISLQLLSVVIILSGIFAITSCSKNKTEGKLQGKWILVKETSPEYLTDSEYYEVWEFRGNNQIVIHRTTTTTNTLQPDTLDHNYGEYYMKSAKKFSIVGIENPRMPIYNSTWQVISLEDNSLLIATDKEPGLFYREFLRE